MKNARVGTPTPSAIPEAIAETAAKASTRGIKAWALVLLTGCALARTAPAQEVKISFGTPQKPLAPNNPYFKAARGFLDAMLQYGRDTYGLPSPMFVGTLNLDSMKAVQTDPNPNVWPKYTVAANPNE